jgi:kumamolisin
MPTMDSVYQVSFHDITTGSNGEYSAVPGYDLVTGWGSFDGPNLIRTLIGLH